MKRSLEYIASTGRRLFFGCRWQRPRENGFHNHYSCQCLSTSSNALEVDDDNNDSVVEMAQPVVVTQHSFHPSEDEPDSTPMVGTTGSASRRPQVSTSRAFRIENQEATQLVDNLLHTTRKMMRPQFDGSGISLTQHLIAFSGGVDSSLVAALVYQLHEPSLGEHVQAVLGISSAVPSEQLHLAQDIAQHIGIPLKQVRTTEGEDETYIANEGQACLACKTHLYSTLQAIVNNHVTRDQELQHRHHHHHQQQQQVHLYNGTNGDDLQDPTRLGLIAADKFHVLSPLSAITKAQVRSASKHLGLPNWNYAASPCLRSRLALGVLATRDHLQRIEQAERFVRQQLVIMDETSNLRVRLLTNNRACIEVDAHVLQLVEEQLEGWMGYFCDTLHFDSIFARAFRSGSVATRSQ